MRTKKQITILVPSGARSGSGNGDSFSFPAYFDDLILFVDTTVAGTTITLNYQVSLDGGTTWGTHTALTAITTTGQVVKLIVGPIASLCRISWSAVTGSFTFSVRGEFSLNGA